MRVAFFFSAPTFGLWSELLVDDGLCSDLARSWSVPGEARRTLFEKGGEPFDVVFAVNERK